MNTMQRVLAQALVGATPVVPGKMVSCGLRRWEKGRSFKHPVCQDCGQPWQLVLGTKNKKHRPQVGTSVPLHQVLIKFNGKFWVYPNGERKRER